LIPSLRAAKDFKIGAAIGQAAPDHAQEWFDSGVDRGIIALNVETLTDTATNPNGDSLFPIAERLNWKLTRFGQQTRSTLRGWWVSGIDPFTWERMEWGRFKPDANTPILDRDKGKPAKYLSPSFGNGSSRLTLLDVPLAIWQRVAHRYQIEIELDDQAKGFWHWVWKHSIPLILTEGEKKAGCLLTLGYAAIALPGIFNGYRKETQALIAELEFFAQRHCSVYVCFDYETKANVLKHINLAISKLSRLLTRSGCETKVITLPGPQKGVDDFVVAEGEAAFGKLYDAALTFSFWQASQLWALTYPAALTLNQRYLGPLPFPNSGLACVRSAKGTGKTAALEPLIHEAVRQGRKVLVLTHRIQLGRAICDRLGLDWIEEVRVSETQGLFGFGLCVDSLHARSQARFNPQEWRGAILILDECEQVVWHALNSRTCYEHRVAVLEAFKGLVQTILRTEGLVIAQDADLSDLSIDYLQGLAEFEIKPWIAVNRWRPSVGWQVIGYDTPNPAPLLVRLEQVLQTGAVFIALGSQKVKGKWSSKNLETYFQRHFPQKRILRIDSESVADPTHPAFGIVERINTVIPDYDIVLATPTIGTGVSIEVQHHFQAVFGIFQGAIPDAEVRQAIVRVRDPVPRYIWAARFGPGKVGNGSCNYHDVAASTVNSIRYNIALLKELDFDLDQQSDPITLRTWAKMAARVNTSMWNYREELWQALQLEGHHLTRIIATLDQLPLVAITALGQAQSPALNQDEIATALNHSSSGELTCPGYELLSQHHDLASIEQVKATIVAIRDYNQQQEAIAVFTAPDIAADHYASLRDQRAKTLEERHTERKHELQKRYPIVMTPQLKLKDDEGWYPQIRLHYYLTHEPEFVRLRDLKEWQGHLDRGGGRVAPQDIRLLSAQVEALRGLGIIALLDSEREVKASDSDVLYIADCCKQCSNDIKTLFNLTISEKMTPIEIIQALLGKMGLKLTCVRRAQAADGRRGGLQIYQYQEPTDDRGTIFAQWQQQDQVVTEQTITALSACFDPPLDTDRSNQSQSGSASNSNQFGAASSPATQRWLPPQIGSVVRLKQQVGEWVVTWVGSATTRLQQVANAWEYIAAWDELIVPPPTVSS
jgi:hypothetical protein